MSDYILTNKEIAQAKRLVTIARNRKDWGLLFNAVQGARFLFQKKGWPDNWTWFVRHLDDIPPDANPAILSGARHERKRWEDA